MSAYLRLLIFFLSILIPACVSSNLALCMMCSVKNLNKQGDNIQLCHSPLPSFETVSGFMSHSNCCFLIHIQVSRETSKIGWYSHLSKYFLQFVVIHKGFSIVNEAEVDTFLDFSCFLYDPMNAANVISVSSAFSKSSLYIS